MWLCTYNEILLCLKMEILSRYTWMNLENIMLSAVSQKQKETVCFHLYNITEVVKIKEEFGGCQGLG